MFFFSLFLKILSLIFAGNILKWKFLGQKWPQMEMEIGIVQSSMGPEFDLMGPWFEIHKNILNFHNWTYGYHELFLENRNK